MVITDLRTIGAESCGRVGADTTSEDTSHGDKWLIVATAALLLLLVVLPESTGDVGLAFIEWFVSGSPI